MDISEAVTVPHKMKRGNYAVNASDTVWNAVAFGNTSPSDIATTYSRETIVRYHGQKGPSGVCDITVHGQQTRGSVCATDSVQGEPIQHRLHQQIEWSNWSMAITLGEAKVVITQTNRRGTQVCATSI